MSAFLIILKCIMLHRESNLSGVREKVHDVIEQNIQNKYNIVYRGTTKHTTPSIQHNKHQSF